MQRLTPRYEELKAHADATEIPWEDGFRPFGTVFDSGNRYRAWVKHRPKNIHFTKSFKYKGEQSKKQAHQEALEWRRQLNREHDLNCYPYRVIPYEGGDFVEMVIQRCNVKHYVFFDADRLEEVKQHCWVVHQEGYIVLQDGRDGLRAKMHRFLAKPPDGMHVDHINGCKTDNRSCNLRIVTQSVNLRNQSTTQSSTCYHNIFYRKKGGKIVGLGVVLSKTSYGDKHNETFAYADYKDERETLRFAILKRNQVG